MYMEVAYCGGIPDLLLLKYLDILYQEISSGDRRIGAMVHPNFFQDTNTLKFSKVVFSSVTNK